MSGAVQIQISDRALERANNALRHVQNGFPLAVARASSRTLEGIPMDTGKETSKRYFVTSSEVRAAVYQKRKPTAGNLVGTVTFRGRRRKLANYKMTPQKPHFRENREGRKVQVLIKAGVKRAGGLKSFDNDNKPSVFLMRRKSGGYFPYIRTGKGNHIESFASPSIPQIIKNEEVVHEVEQLGAERFEKRLLHEVEHILDTVQGS